MGKGIYYWDRLNVYVIDSTSGHLIHKSADCDVTGASDMYGCVMADGRVLISAETEANTDNPAYGILDAGLQHWRNGPTLKVVDGLDPRIDVDGVVVNTMLIAGNKFVAFGYLLSGRFGQNDCIVQLRSLQDPTVIGVHDLLYDLGDFNGDESSPEAPAASGDYVHYSTEGAYIHSVNVKTWALTLPINLSDEPDKYSEDERDVGSESAIDTDLQGSAVDETTHRIWAFAYNEQEGDPDFWTSEEIQIFSAPVGTEHQWRLEANISPPPDVQLFYHRTFSGSGLVIHPYYYLASERHQIISRYNMTTGEMEWTWVDVSTFGADVGFILTGSGKGGLQPIPGVHLDQGARFDPSHEPRGDRRGVRP